MIIVVRPNYVTYIVIGDIYRFGLKVVIVIHVLYFFKSNSRPNRGIFVIMFMLGKATVKIK